MNSNAEQNFYFSDEVQKELFYQFPKFLISDSNYCKLSEAAKIAYMLFKHRFEYSLRNGWKDENNRIYLIFTQAELKQLLNCHEGKVSKILKELESKKLLYIQKQNFDPNTGKKSPNRYYLLKPVLSEDSVYNRKSTIKPHAKIAYGENVDVTAFEKSNLEEPRFSPYAKIAVNKDNIKQDTLKEDTIEIDTDKDYQLNQELLATFHLTNTQTFLNENSLKFIALFSKTFDQAYETVGIIQRAKKKVEKEMGIVVIGEDWQEEIELHLRRVVQKIRTDHKIKNTDNYMFKSFCYFFQECSHRLMATSQKGTTNEVLMYNFLEGESL